MKILIVGDEISKAYYDFFEKEMLDDVDLILSCGDLPSDYLSFLVTFAHCPLLYIHGNHDSKYLTKPPEGCESVEDRIYVYKGIRILGLGGSMRYHPKVAKYTQYSPQEMERRINRLKWELFRHRGFDILLAHSPAEGLGDASDLPHRGFAVFNKLLDRYKPPYFIHGHVQFSYNYKQPRTTQYGETTIINGCGTYILEIPDVDPVIAAKRQKKYRPPKEKWDDNTEII